MVNDSRWRRSSRVGSSARSAGRQASAFLQHVLRKIGAQTHTHHQRIERIGRLLKAADAFPSTLTHRPPSSSQAGDMGADNFAVLGFGMQVGDGNFSRSLRSSG